MRHIKLYYKALFIDDFVERFMKIRGRTLFPHKEVGYLVKWLFPQSKFLGRGAHKTVYRVYSDKKILVMKVAKKSAIKSDTRVYNRIPLSIRNRHFAKIYHNTDYCIFQKYGKEKKIPPEIKHRLKMLGKEHGLRDIRDDNIRFIDGHPKIVDASIVN